MKRIIIVILTMLILSGICYAQPTELTEREMLIQLCGKVDFINEGITRIE